MSKSVKNLPDRVAEVRDAVNELIEDVREALLTEFDSEQEKKDHEEVVNDLTAMRRSGARSVFVGPVEPISIPSDGTDDETRAKSKRS